jgi:hypothetical protein
MWVGSSVGIATYYRLDGPGIESRLGRDIPHPLRTFLSPTQPTVHWVKIKVPLYRPGVAQRVGRGIDLLFHDFGTRSGEWSEARSGRNLLPGKPRYPLYRRLDGTQGRSGQAENLAPNGIRSSDSPFSSQSLHRLN